MSLIPEFEGSPMEVLDEIRRILVPDSMYYYTRGFSGEFELRNIDGDVLVAWGDKVDEVLRTIKEPVW